MAASPGSQPQGTGLDCFTSWYLFPSAVNKCNELKFQPLNPTQHWLCWWSWGHPTPVQGSRRSTCLDLPRDLVLEMSCLNLLRGLPVQGSQEVDMPQPAQGPSSQEAHLPWPAWGFYLQEAVTPQPAWGSAPWPRDAWLSGCNSTG